MNSPTPNTVEVVVDMRDAAGCAVDLHYQKDVFADMVGMDYNGNKVVVPWEEGQKLVCYGRPV
ncbi:hypothetical protein CDEST_04461 [Colletotrichum destructivum]|uniref:Uncharacterized protein n=1 Tax=Colletotrichum destructivum TaxID=34406 RepID=A0AAX4I7T5_9PEZI|nr:hypothetical protein CDEST_04461 [Colletotrichum destructivum]